MRLHPDVSYPAKCLHCGKDCTPAFGDEIYPHRLDLYEMVFWVCKPCGARVGCHKGTVHPLGLAANEETRKARLDLHQNHFDPVWKTGQKARGKKRRRLYAYLAFHMGLTKEECHIGRFTAAQCEQAKLFLKGLNNHIVADWYYSKERAA
jgi:hypothetical protein